MDASLIEEGDGSTTPSLFINVLLFIILILNIFLLFPLCVFVRFVSPPNPKLSLTPLGLLHTPRCPPTIAAASPPNSFSYAQLPLSYLESDVPSSLAKPREPSVFRPDLSIRPMLSQLISHRTQYKYLAFFRGCGLCICIGFLDISASSSQAS